MKLISTTLAFALMAFASCSKPQAETQGAESQPQTEAAAEEPVSPAESENIESIPDSPTPESPAEKAIDIVTNQNATKQMSSTSGDVDVLIKTSVGDITVRLYGDTPKHRDNFVKLAKQGFYDGVLFHRVINEFMIQTGDPDSKNAPAGKMLGSGDPGYTLEAEFVYPKHFHKRGALAAARTGDNVNPQRRSSGSQFYIVTGQKFNESQMGQLEQQLQMGQQQEIFNRLVSERRDKIIEMQRTGDNAGLQQLQDELIAMTEAEAAKSPAKLTPEQRQAYTTVGGAPHLDGQYTVFGEVIKGMDVVDKIEKVETDRNDRPKQDIKILSMEVLN